jgi:hypothetical protein
MLKQVGALGNHTNRTISRDAAGMHVIEFWVRGCLKQRQTPAEAPTPQSCLILLGTV